MATPITNERQRMLYGALLLASATLSNIASPAALPAPALRAKANDLKQIVLPDGLRYKEIIVGHGAEPRKGQTVRVHYVGTLLSGKKFDSSRDRGQPFEFVLGESQVIAGWDEGVATMHVGGRRTLIVPAKLGYGDEGAGGGVIPPGATLVFDIELLGVR